MPGFPTFRGRRAPITALALALALVPAGAAHAGGPPVIKKVKPMQVEVGQTLEIFGTGFRAGANKNIVAFKRSRKPAVFVKVPTATATKLTLPIPEKLLPFLVDDKGQSGVRKFRLRVLARRFGKAFTSAKLSPKVGPPGSGGLGAAPAPGAPAECKAVPASAVIDTDKDGLSDALETAIKTDPCKLDSDTDGVSDGFEYESALDLNSRALPYAGKKPYPNPLDLGDALLDYDGDGLTLADEYQLWLYTTKGGTFPLTYSDGNQDTGGPTGAGGSPLDMSGEGVLTDDEKDADGDGIGNWDEAHGRLTAGWWEGVFAGIETPFFGKASNAAMQMAELSMADPDTDGDTLADGADDQDQDGYTNVQEIDRHYAVIARGNMWVNPYNPCLPDPTTRACTLHPPLGSPWSPFGAKGAVPPGPYPLVTTELGPGPNRIPQVFG